MSSSYQAEQLEALCLVRLHLKSMPHAERDRLRAQITVYMDFRRRMDAFLERNFGDICSTACYRSRLSACCSREGIVTFFADVAINLLNSDEHEADLLVKALRTENTGLKCVYLGPEGCLWRVKPIVCQMFLCDPAKARAFGNRPDLQTEWAGFEQERKLFTWPDRPVLFDLLEAHFISAGCSSSLMYLHQSPGLLRIKRRAGLY
ncbi:MAG: hypothetical protein R6V84_11505 [Desulfobacterales bacterium]